MAQDGIDRVLQAAVDDGRVPGVVALAADSSGPIYQGAFGRRSLAGTAPMSLDTMFHIASMTKAVTGVAAMQCVERGQLALDQPAGEILPELAEPQVLEGFDAAGEPKLRPARGKITLRNLLTHTAGFVYPVWNQLNARYCQSKQVPSILSGKRAALDVPLAFEPGERWEYGINIDWAGLMVEKVSGQDLETFMRANIFAPLGMHDTSFVLNGGQTARLVDVHARRPDGSLTVLPAEPPPQLEFHPGGGGLSSTGTDYLAFLRMLLHGGELNGARVLKPETVAMMQQNHIGGRNVENMQTVMPELSNDVALFPDMGQKWGLTWLINTDDKPARRSAGSVAWAGIFNTYYWLDPKRQVTGVIMTQILPFADPIVLQLLTDFETAVYKETASHG